MVSRRKSADDSVGKKYGKLTVLEITDKRSKDGKIIVRCLCDCGTEHHVRLTLLKQGRQLSCGCLLDEARAENSKKAVEILRSRGVYKEPRISTAIQVYVHHSYDNGDLSFNDFLDISQEDCFYCGVPPSNCTNRFKYYPNNYSEQRIKEGNFIYNGLDRVDNTKSHTKDNVVPCCLPCNQAKLARTQPEFFNWIGMVYNLHKNKIK